MNNSTEKVTYKRPHPVTAVALLFIIVPGIFGLIYHAQELFEGKHSIYEVLWVLFLRALALVTGVFLLRGSDWARWLALAWIAYHVVLSAFHSLSETLVHLALLVAIAVLLFLPKASAFFRHSQSVN